MKSGPGKGKSAPPVEGQNTLNARWRGTRTSNGARRADPSGQNSRQLVRRRLQPIHDANVCRVCNPICNPTSDNWPTLDKRETRSRSPNTQVTRTGSGGGIPCGTGTGGTHNPEVVGSNPTPATTKALVTGPFSMGGSVQGSAFATFLQRNCGEPIVKVRYLCPTLAPAPLSH
jgi:hypothetical protein